MIKTNTLICKTLSENMSGVELVENEILAPRDHEILIEVKAASVNFPDLLMTQGKYQHKPELPFGLGMEGAGIVQSVGYKVSKVKEEGPRFSHKVNIP